jgi:hypothetical protein
VPGEIQVHRIHRADQDPGKVAGRCPRFKTFTEWLTAEIEAA